MAIQLTTYYKKTEELGAVELSVPADAFAGWTLNGVELNVAVAEYLIRYGIKQSLADSIASAKTIDEAHGLYQKRRDAMLNNTIGVRESSGIKIDDDPVTTLAVKTAKEALFARFKKLLPNAKKMVDFIGHEKIAPYLSAAKTDPTKAVWNDKAVMEWIGRMKEGGKDFMAEAAESLKVDVTVDLDF